jgi:hypothetical protein
MAKTVTQFENDVASIVKSIIDADIANLATVTANAPFSVIQSYADAVNRSVKEMTTAIGASYTPFGPEEFPVIIGAQVVAATDMFPEDLRPKLKNSVFRVSCILNTTAAKLQIKIKNTGSQSPIKGILNSNATLAVDNLFVFDIPVHVGYKYNFQVDTTTIVNYLSVMEIIP